MRNDLSDENHAELLEAVCGKPKCEVEAMIAKRSPKPDSPSRVQALAEGRFKVEFTASAELRDKLELCRDLMSHANPCRDLGVVIEHAVDLLIGHLERKQTKARRKVFERDGLRCTYVSPDGRRCASRTFLELDHAEPRALGGADSHDNLRVFCRAHNQLAAEQILTVPVSAVNSMPRGKKARSHSLRGLCVQQGARPQPLPTFLFVSTATRREFSIALRRAARATSRRM